MDKREAFEEHARKYGYSTRRASDGSYYENRIETLWATWKAALSHQQEAEPIYQVWFSKGQWTDVPKSVFDKDPAGDRSRVVYTHPSPTEQESRVPEELSASEAVFGLMGWLTSREEVTPHLSGSHEATVGADIAAQFIESNGLSEPREGWYKKLVHPKPSSAPTLPDNPQWVSVEERLPTEEDEDFDGVIWAANICGGTERINANLFCIDSNLYTHWMPTNLVRPEPPENQK